MKISSHNCCGCALCAAVCPVNAVEMKAGYDGFLRPQINEALCVQCGKCQKSCPENRENPLPPEQHCYYAVSSRSTCVQTSSSGGIFSELVRYVLAAGGGAAGVLFDEKFQAVMKLSSDEEEISRMKQAKYVQAVVAPGFYQEIRDFLAGGRPLLLTGTPCQIAAVKAALGEEEYPGLLTAEVICHGVPSPRVWQSYLENAAVAAGRIRHVECRNKSRGWHEYAAKIEGEKGVLLDGRHESPYMKLFIGNVILRPSCSDCRFKAGRSGADLSLGDFWKLRKVAPDMDNRSGVSMVLTHSSRGEKVLKELSCACLKEFPWKTVRQCNRAFFDSAPLHPGREEYFEKFNADQGKWFDPGAFLKSYAVKKSPWEGVKKIFKKFFH